MLRCAGANLAACAKNVSCLTNPVKLVTIILQDGELVDNPSHWEKKTTPKKDWRRKPHIHIHSCGKLKANLY